MTDKYNVIFKGETIKDMDIETVRARFEEAFKASESKMDALFSGLPVTIRKNVTEKEALRFVAALESIGAKAEIQMIGTVPEADTARDIPPPPQTTVNIAPQESIDSLSLAAVGSRLSEHNESDQTPPPTPGDWDLLPK